jgi:hypothetical protein
VAAPTEALRRLDDQHTDPSETRVTRTPFRLVLLFLVALAAFAATAGTAAAAKSCGEKVIDDWYGSKSGQLTKTYPIHCYRQALKLVQNRTDLTVYSNAKQDITFAMQLAIARNNGKGGPPSGAGVYSSDPRLTDALPSFRGGPDAENGGHPPSSVGPTQPTGPKNTSPLGGPLQSSSPSSVPLPAIILAAIAALLLALGAAAFVARRRQTRRQTLTPRHANGRNP